MIYGISGLVPISPEKSRILDLSGVMRIHLGVIEKGLLAGVLKKGFLLGS